MGLDQYAYAVCAVLPGLKPTDGDGEKIADWRKHNRLQGWMEALYRSKGGDAEDFNCVSVDITLDDLDALETAINNRDLPETGGFFFGTDSYDNYDEWHADEDQGFLVKAREALNIGKTVYYSSWW